MLFKYTSVVSLLSAALLVNALPSPAVPIAPPAVKKYHFNLDIYTENYETGKHQAIHKVLYNVLGCECWPLDDHTKGHVKSYTFLSKDRDLHIAFYSDDKCFVRFQILYIFPFALMYHPCSFAHVLRNDTWMQNKRARDCQRNTTVQLQGVQFRARQSKRRV
ncbi:hypothetical protein BV22DRAFT_1034470 [Leucogyrophana mollusca]|uniref:Uncharacterized protein n=1 Tax=Leucogyrophana mollusca TaxID=85980 RepID=A0ACB8BHT3_9AGAM|nr:hypothetical protein BV22DRAFT_1034470 [Leucogyrophana mollusca]